MTKLTYESAEINQVTFNERKRDVVNQVTSFFKLTFVLLEEI